MTVGIRTTVPLPIEASDTPVVVSFEGLTDGDEHVAVLFGEPRPDALVRIHSECMTGDVFGSLRCDCGPQLREAIKLLDRDGGILLYMRQEGRGIGLYNKLDAYSLQDIGLDTFAANVELGRGKDERSYEDCARMLQALGVHRCRLLTNNPEKVLGLEHHGTHVSEVVATGYFRQERNAAYLDSKERLAGHRFSPVGQRDERKSPDRARWQAGSRPA